jgi:hypothetical protein
MEAYLCPLWARGSKAILKGLQVSGMKRKETWALRKGKDLKSATSSSQRGDDEKKKLAAEWMRSSKSVWLKIKAVRKPHKRTRKLERKWHGAGFSA